MTTALQSNRILAAAERYRPAIAANPDYAADGMARELSPETAWAFSEWTGRARERHIIADEEAETVLAAIGRPTGANWTRGWASSADLGLRCAVVQLIAELLAGGIG